MEFICSAVFFLQNAELMFCGRKKKPNFLSVYFLNRKCWNHFSARSELAAPAQSHSCVSCHFNGILLDWVLLSASIQLSRCTTVLHFSFSSYRSVCIRQRQPALNRCFCSFLWDHNLRGRRCSAEWGKQCLPPPPLLLLIPHPLLSSSGAPILCPSALHPSTIKANSVRLLTRKPG